MQPMTRADDPTEETALESFVGMVATLLWAVALIAARVTGSITVGVVLGGIWLAAALVWLIFYIGRLRRSFRAGRDGSARTTGR